MKPLIELASKLNVPIFFEEKWKEREKLRDEGYKLINEGNKLWIKGNKLKSEGQKIWSESYKMWDESDKLKSEGQKLWGEGYKLWDEGDVLYRNVVTKNCGKKATIDWDTGEVTVG